MARATIEAMYPVGMRVKERFNKLSPMRGVVVGHTGSLHVRVQWDGKPYPTDWLFPAIREDPSYEGT